jgi:hypothetical protein
MPTELGGFGMRPSNVGDTVSKLIGGITRDRAESQRLLLINSAYSSLVADGLSTVGHVLKLSVSFTDSKGERDQSLQ